MQRFKKLRRVTRQEFLDFILSIGAPAARCKTHKAVVPPSDVNVGKKNKKPSGYVKIAIEHGHRNSEFSHYKNCDLPYFLYVYQRVGLDLSHD